MRICFFGTPEFASFSLKKIIESGHEVVCVVTAPDKPKGRGLKVVQSDVKKVALEFDIPVLQPTNLKSPEFHVELRSFNIDLGVVIAFRMLPEIVWDMPRLGTFNLHASLLPNYRGAAPINHAIINGETETGLSTFFLKHAIDTGDILLQERVPIGPNENVGELYHKLMIKGALLVTDSLNLIKSGNYTLKTQILTGEERHAPKIFRDFCEIKHDLSASQTHNKIRGLNPFPGAWCISERLGECKIAETLPAENIKAQGLDFFAFENKLYWPCADGCIEILQLKISGKRVLSASDILNGYFK